MRFLFFICLAALFSACNSSSSKKDPRQAMDDSAGMPARLNDSGGNNPPANTTASVTIEPVKITAADIPASIKIKGKVQEVWKWNDNQGENILITSYVAPFNDKEKNKYGEEGQTAELYAFHYAKKDGDYIQIWTMSDTEKSCPFDITCEFPKGSTTITDLDKDGIPEIKVQYIIACRSDVSPADMRLNMYENGRLYMLRGSTWIPYSPEFKFEVTENNVNLEKLLPPKDETDAMLRSFGRYENENDFAAAPPEFIAFARREWLKYCREKMGE